MPADPALKLAGEPSSQATAAFYREGISKIQEKFEATGDGCAATLERSALVDAVLERLHRESFADDPSGPAGFCLVALGGYGRRELFPYSDIDLLFLTADNRTATLHREAQARIARTLWDLRLRVGSVCRPLEECSRLHRDNLEFNVALLDARSLTGDPELFTRLRARAIPRFVAHDRQTLVRELVEITRGRHAKFGHTIFHLEPNLKEAPGGLRDYQVARWLSAIPHLAKREPNAAEESHWPEALKNEIRSAVEFQFAARCFLHFVQGRDNNQLSYELQDSAAAARIGQTEKDSTDVAEWMRRYFRHARTLHRLASQLLEEAEPRRASLLATVRDRSSKLSNSKFSVAWGRLAPRPRHTSTTDAVALLDLFNMVARHGFELSREAERWVEESLERLKPVGKRVPGLWAAFRQLLLLPLGANALRAMHRLGVLVKLFPEFRAIDSLVVRDFYHRYTVDEHTFLTLQALKNLPSTRSGTRKGHAKDSGNVWEAKFGEILDEIEQPELLFLALIFHDVGKGMKTNNHISGSLEALEAVMDRLELAPEDREAVAFLVAQHLEMSATLQRRDVFDHETVRSFAEQVGTVERLKMLTLLTYADIKSVNPEALTPWKAEMLWQLSVAASNYLTRSLDEERFHSAAEGLAKVQSILSLLSSPSAAAELAAFLEGFPRRYLAAHSLEEIAAHFEMARRLAQDPVQVNLRARHQLFELTVLTPDRPLLFASLTGALAAWGMNIVKADAFANSSGTVLDTFRFADLFRTLELNPSERGRFRQNIAAVLRGKVKLEDLLKARMHPRASQRPKVKISTEVRFDDESSTHSTLLELITQDRPGLLYQVSSALAELECNIEVALIDTEGQKVIDVFYLTFRKGKLDALKQEEVREAILARIERRA